MKKYLLILVILLLPLNAYCLSKTETIYATIDSTGKVENTSINTKLANLDSGEIIDYTKLDKIKNLNGEEKFSYETGRITWTSTGKDIVYKGVLNDSLPVEVNVKYYLENDEIKLNKLINKKGNIRIVYTFKNNSYDYQSSMYIPFVISLATTMNKNNSNINITNGKVINTGNINVASAIAAPGLYDNFKLEELKNLDQITISYKTTKFKANDVYFIITPKLLDSIDVSKLNKLDSIYSSINTLQNGMDELENGSNKISAGNEQFALYLEELNNGLKKATNGSSEITKNLQLVSSGSNDLTSLSTLVEELYKTYQENLVLLKNIASGKTETELKEAIRKATEEKTNYENQLIGVNTKIEALEQLTELSEEQSLQLEMLKSNKVALENAILKYEQGIAEAQANLNSLPLAPAKISGANEVITKILCSILKVNDIVEVNEEVINNFKTSINNLVGGINQLANASGELSTGLNSLQEGSSKLVEGNKELVNGSIQLSEGVRKINNEGIKKLSSYSKLINNYSDKVKTLVKLAHNYKGYGCENADNTLFVYRQSTK